MGALGALAVLCLGGASLAAARTTRSSAPPASPGSSHANKSGCDLGGDGPGNSGGKIKHVIYLQFDNVHYNRDNPDVESDLQQMPHLLNFLTENGTLFTNDHTILISHTAGGILSSLTGLYPDRQGQTVSNSYDYFPASKLPAFTSSFKYWTAPVDPVNDPKANMITDTGLTTPAPWVPYTRAGCDVGGVGTANIELENNSTAANGDITKVFGNPSDQATEANTNPQQAQTDFVGIAIHCSQASTSVCAGDQNARPDPLPDEPMADGTPGNGNGYKGFNALYGAKYVDPAITNGNACVNDTGGNPITDPVGYCGFPGFDGMFASNTLGYVAAMQEAGVQVTYGYISDVHDLHAPIGSSDSYSSSATGPGEIGHEAQLKAYDQAFESFFNDLDQHGINKSNTLFVITVDEGDHFAGGVGVPQSGQNWLLYNHSTCTDLTKCTANQLGEIGTNIKSLTGAVTTSYDIHPDDAPAFYLNGQPGPTDTTVRNLERLVGGLKATDPYVRQNNTPQTVNLTEAMADPAEFPALHMINADSSRTPTFVDFGNPDYFFQTSNPCSGVSMCVTSGFAWNHGDIQQEIGNTWAGFVGPGIANNGIDKDTWTDHTNLRPTILSLVGLQDDYTDDGHVLVQALTKQAVPDGLSGSKIAQLEQVDEQLNAPFGDYAEATLAASTKALEGSDTDYTNFTTPMSTLEPNRDVLAKTIRNALSDAAFNGGTITDAQATTWINQANGYIQQAQGLPH
jgi:hypothetical protein